MFESSAGGAVLAHTSTARTSSSTGSSASECSTARIQSRCTAPRRAAAITARPLQVCGNFFLNYIYYYYGYMFCESKFKLFLNIHGLSFSYCYQVEST